MVRNYLIINREDLDRAWQMLEQRGHEKWVGIPTNTSMGFVPGEGYKSSLLESLRLLFAKPKPLEDYSGIYHTFSEQDVAELVNAGIRLLQMTKDDAIAIVEKPSGLEWLMYDS